MTPSHPLPHLSPSPPRPPSPMKSQSQVIEGFFPGISTAEVDVLAADTLGLAVWPQNLERTKILDPTNPKTLNPQP